MGLIEIEECAICRLYKECVHRTMHEHFDIWICKECLQTMLRELEYFGEDEEAVKVRTERAHKKAKERHDELRVRE